MMGALAWIGRRASYVMLFGMLGVALLPGLSAALRPFLPLLVAWVLGLAIARLDLRAALGAMLAPRHMLRLLALVLVMMPGTTLLMASSARVLGIGNDMVLLLVVFAAAPPLSSSTSLSLLLGYNARITLQVTLLATLALPALAPLCLGLAGVEVDIAPLALALRLAAMIAGGIVIGLGLQRLLGPERIARNAQAFNGAVALSMLVFLFPLFDGVWPAVAAAPGLALGLLALAVALNIGSNLLVARFGRTVTETQTAQALGLMFGNRNISFYLAVLPVNPLLGLFVAVAQLPIYATPLIFLRKPGAPEPAE